MTMSHGNENKFEPHSDEDLATILEAQLLAMRGNSLGPRNQPAVEIAAVEVVAGVEEADVEGVAVDVVGVVSLLRSSVPTEMPMMFAEAEMHALMNATTTPSGFTSVVVPAEEAVVEEVAVQVVAVEEAVVQDAVVHDVPVEKAAFEFPSAKKHLPDLPVFVRKSFDDLISGS